MFLATGFIDGGSVNGSMLRRLAYAAVSGGSGVVQYGDLKVIASGTASVSVSAGTGFATTRFAGAYAAQSYIIANDAAEVVAVPANASGSTVVWQLILRVSDPQYAGEPVPGDPAAATYVVAELVTSLPTTKPYLWLATITMAAGASTVTQAQVTDQRTMAAPRAQRLLKAVNPTGSEALSSTSVVKWPAAGSWSVDVPAWATRAVVIGTWGGVYNPKAQSNASVSVRIGTGRADVITTQDVQIDTDGTGEASRSSVVCPTTVSIPATMRGQTVTVDMLGKRNSGSSSIRIDTASAACVDIEFTETAL